MRYFRKTLLWLMYLGLYVILVSYKFSFMNVLILIYATFIMFFDTTVRPIDEIIDKIKK